MIIAMASNTGVGVRGKTREEHAEEEEKATGGNDRGTGKRVFTISGEAIMPPLSWLGKKSTLETIGSRWKNDVSSRVRRN